ncbi:MAG: sigma-54-dependent Fis family transcriptional regulator [Myxococcales bacterium]|nr:sigma-54-dependent Fis family transcriptional regulator [Myxococcales bacterium]
MKILIVDDQKTFRRVLRGIVEKLPKTEIFEAASLDEARSVFRDERPDVLLVDVRLSDDARNRDGLTLVSELAGLPRVKLICVTASSEMALIRQAMRSGAFDYILKDDLSDDLILPILREIDVQIGLEATTGRAKPADESPVSGLVGDSAAMVALRERIVRIAASDRPVLITGPTGSGKEEVARALHKAGTNPAAPFYDLNCGAFSETLAESELFGHVKGSFTGATSDRDGCFKAVRNGTLFLDELGELSKDLQAKLLRAIEARQFRPIGWDRSPLPFVGRIVAATNEDLRARVKEKTFREDLLYRLAVLEIVVPPLEERLGDIPQLVAYLSAKQSRPLRFSPEAIDALRAMRWPGNVRQLRTVVDRLAVFAQRDLVSAADIREVSDEGFADGNDRLHRLADTLLDMTPGGDRVVSVEDALYARALERAEGNNTHAGRLLGVSRKSVERWRKRTSVSRWRISNNEPDNDSEQD